MAHLQMIFARNLHLFHGFSMAMLVITSIDGLPIKNGDFPWLC